MRSAEERMGTEALRGRKSGDEELKKRKIGNEVVR